MAAETKIVYRASQPTNRAPAFNAHMKLPGYSGFVPGATNVIEKNYYETSQRCFSKRQEARDADILSRAAGARQRSFNPSLRSARAQTSPQVEPARYLVGYAGYVPQCRFTFECSEGTLAKTWAPRTPINGLPGPGTQNPCLYSPAKEKYKPRQDKYIIGYKGFLPGAQGQIEKSYARVARNVELGRGEGPRTEELLQPKPRAAYNPKTPPTQSIQDYKLPGYTGFVPQNNFQFEKRYSQTVVDAGKQYQALQSRGH